MIEGVATFVAMPFLEKVYKNFHSVWCNQNTAVL